MQKLSVKLRNTPGNASQVPCSVSEALNREEALGVPCKVLVDNNPEENKLQKERQNLRVSVYVLNMRGQPLMPTTSRRARILIKEGKAKVVKRTPFTIQLNYATGENKQPIKMGIDSGYSAIGFSIVLGKKELISGDVEVRTDIPKKLIEKRMYRRGRRNKHHWYREPRFDNRGKEAWLAPSIKHKLQTHITLIDKIKELLPVTAITIEVASFDQQKMQNPEITGIEYQQGELQGYEVREYLLEKYERKCAYCGKGNILLEVEHIVPKSRGGSDRVSNLTISCHRCNQKKNNKTAEEFGHPEVQEQAKQSLKDAAFMNTVRWKLVNMLDCEHTYGYITKHDRIKQGLEKSHINDAFVIAGGTDQLRVKSFSVKQNRRNNRVLQLNRNGFKPSIRRKRYKFQPNDIVAHKGTVYFIKGVHNYGKSVVLKTTDKKIIDTNIKNIELIQYGKGLQFVY